MSANAAPVYPATVRPCAATIDRAGSERRHHRQAVRRSTVATVCRVPLPACQRFDRAASLSGKPSRRKRPPEVCRRIRHHRRKRAGNALASRPPPVPCPRPSETRRAFCKPFSTVCNAGKDSPARPAPDSGKPWRPLAGSVRPVSDSGEHRNAATIGSGQPFDRAAGSVPPVYPATVRPCRRKRPRLSAVRRPWKIQGDSRIFKAHKALSNFAPRFSFRPSARGGKPSAVRPLRLLRQRKRRAYSGKPSACLSGDRAPPVSGSTMCARFRFARPFRAVSHILADILAFSHFRARGKIPRPSGLCGIGGVFSGENPAPVPYNPASVRLIPALQGNEKKRARAAFPSALVFSRAAPRGIFRREQIPPITNAARRALLFTGFCVLYHNPSNRDHNIPSDPDHNGDHNIPSNRDHNGDHNGVFAGINQ